MGCCSPHPKNEATLPFPDQALIAVSDGELRKKPSGVEEDTKPKEVIRETPKGPALSSAGTFGCRTEEKGPGQVLGCPIERVGTTGVAPGDGT